MPNTTGRRFVVMCCGCLRLMGKGGEMIGDRYTHGGAVDLFKFCARFNGQEDPAMFASFAAADEAAKSFGWETRASDGTPDHRCPECRSSKPATERQGAYIQWPIPSTKEPTPNA